MTQIKIIIHKDKNEKEQKTHNLEGEGWLRRLNSSETRHSTLRHALLAALIPPLKVLGPSFSFRFQKMKNFDFLGFSKSNDPSWLSDAAALHFLGTPKKG